jgi:hypothetical protein
LTNQGGADRKKNFMETRRLGGGSFHLAMIKKKDSGQKARLLYGARGCGFKVSSVIAAPDRIESAAWISFQT